MSTCTRCGVHTDDSVDRADISVSLYGKGSNLCDDCLAALRPCQCCILCFDNDGRNITQSVMVDHNMLPFKSEAAAEDYLKDCGCPTFPDHTYLIRPLLRGPIPPEDLVRSGKYDEQVSPASLKLSQLSEDRKMQLPDDDPMWGGDGLPNSEPPGVQGEDGVRDNDATPIDDFPTGPTGVSGPVCCGGLSTGKYPGNTPVIIRQSGCLETWPHYPRCQCGITVIRLVEGKIMCDNNACRRDRTTEFFKELQP